LYSGRTAYLRAARERYARRRGPAYFAPYDVSIYRTFLGAIRAQSNVEVLPFVSHGDGGSGSRAKFYFRHDIDTAECVKNLPALLEADAEYAVPCGVYVRTDGAEYDPSSLSALAPKYRDRAVEFGLHTGCYVHDDYWGAFEAELEAFRSALGFEATSVTVHGLGSFRHAVRIQFAEGLPARAAEYGISFTDCNPAYRQYEYVYEDCHLQQADARRFIYDDFVGAPKFVVRGANYLVLTHPCYWR
jgi:hypothetical protein